MRILVTGSEGYLGSLLTPLLIEQGHEVRGVDTGYYKSGLLYLSSSVTPSTLTKDVRAINRGDLEGTDAIVHMAELSNDPVCELAPEMTCEINHRGSVHLARTAKECGIGRFVYMSSCSVYGIATEAYVTEESRLNPQTVYARCKALVEREVAQMADDKFSPTFLRNATAYGASPRMRFDIVLNNLAGLAWTTREIRLVSDGTPWRPLVHGLDVAQAIVAILRAPRDIVHNEVLNVGKTSHNYTIREIAETVAEVFPGCRLSFGKHDPDQRSYRVSFDKIKAKLPGFACGWDIRMGARELYDTFRQINLTADLFHNPAFTRVAQLRHLIRTRRLDDRFFWRNGAAARRQGASQR
jgi:nucleoside-diphosphate-sugar epimerase